jgi:hypothetical protein
MSKTQIEVECSACGATGLYCGFAEPKGVAVVCRQCGGTGKEVLSGTPFTYRKRRRNVEWVMDDGGMWFARTGGESKILVSKFYNEEEV